MSSSEQQYKFKWFISAILIFLLAAILHYKIFQEVPSPFISQNKTTKDNMSNKLLSSASSVIGMKKLPVYFFSHGGPTFMYPEDGFGGNPEAYHVVSKTGKFIKEVIKPKFIIAVSAHWQSSGPNLIEVAVPAGVSGVSKGLSDAFPPGPSKKNSPLLDPMENDLIYDFYGFPDYMYKETFHSKCDVDLARDIVSEINNSDGTLKAKLSKRGIDHGAWVPFKVAFSTNKPADETWDVDVPLVQVSMTSSDDFDTHYELGKILSKYREKGGQIIVSGMSVHNLRDFGRAASLGHPMPYVKQFNNLLADIFSKPEGKLSDFKDILKNPDTKKLLYSAHPTLDHFMPLIVGLGAGEGIKGDDQYTVKQIYTGETLSLGWGLYQFGNYDA